MTASQKSHECLGMFRLDAFASLPPQLWHTSEISEIWETFHATPSRCSVVQTSDCVIWECRWLRGCGRSVHTRLHSPFSCSLFTPLLLTLRCLPLSHFVFILTARLSSRAYKPVSIMWLVTVHLGQTLSSEFCNNVRSFVRRFVLLN
jgi:hypothetical protein